MFFRRRTKGPLADFLIGVVLLWFGGWYLFSDRAPDYCVGLRVGDTCFLGTTALGVFIGLIGLVFVVSAADIAWNKRIGE